jgi:hypothetical protein
MTQIQNNAVGLEAKNMMVPFFLFSSKVTFMLNIVFLGKIRPFCMQKTWISK